MLKADLHVHSSCSPDSRASPKSIVERCTKVGLNCIAVTDHNTIEGAKEVNRIAPFRVIIGEEVKSTQGDIIGLFLKETVPQGLSPLETVKRIKGQGGLVSLPHPFDRLRGSALAHQALEEIFPYTDIVEGFNARAVFKTYNNRAKGLAKGRGLLMCAVSDAHHPLELGHTYTEMPDFDGTPDSFKQALSHARLVERRTVMLVMAVRIYSRVRKILRPQRG